MLSDIHFTFGILLCHTKIQIKFEYGVDPLIFHEVMALGLREISRILSFPQFFVRAFRYLFDIWNMALAYQDTDQLPVCDLLICHEVMALGRRKISQIPSFPHFFRYSFDIWYIALPYQDTDQV
jgi:hypothetical protein